MSTLTADLAVNGAEVRSADTHEFRRGHRYAHRTALVSTGVLAFALVVLLLATGQNASAIGHAISLVAIVGLSAATVALVIIARHRPVQLRVGPEGLSLPFRFAEPIRWGDIKNIALMPRHVALFSDRRWLAVTLHEGTAPPLSLPLPPSVQVWINRTFAIHVPLYALHGTTDDVISSIRRYASVQQGSI